MEANTILKNMFIALLALFALAGCASSKLESQVKTSAAEQPAVTVTEAPAEAQAPAPAAAPTQAAAPATLQEKAQSTAAECSKAYASKKACEKAPGPFGIGVKVCMEQLKKRVGGLNCPIPIF